jgi:23S rRNA (adenine2503-C2)-methyltransferase
MGYGATMSTPARPNLLGLLPEDLAPLLPIEADPVQALGVARRVLAHLISFGHPDLHSMKRPPKLKVLRWLEANTTWERLEVVERVPDSVDHSVRYLFRHADGALTEAVCIPLERPNRYSVCLSSQAGCAMQCAFCATGRLGLTRHLKAWEMVAAWLTVRDELPAGSRVSGAVFMGQGEPLHNYDAVLQAAHVLREPCGGRISGKAISISTVGLVPRIHQYAKEGHPFRLVVSLTSADPDKRKALLPVAGKWSLEELADALRAYHQSCGSRVTIAWVLMSGINTGADEAERIRDLLGDIPLRVNLIDVNGSADPTGRFFPAPDAERDAFFDALQILGAPVVRRYSVGRSESSACGMLAAQRTSEAAAP